VIRSALRGGWRSGGLTIAGNSLGAVVWGLLPVLGISALAAASERATGAVLIALGARVALEQR
jgi:threonine/homoserine/homoserine lactone efflux protein